MVTTRSQFSKRHGARLGDLRHILQPQIHGKSSAPAKPTATRSLDHFEYCHLQDASKDIRLITLLPGDDNEPIMIHIKHTRLPDYVKDAPSSCKEILAEIQTTLPPGWTIYETLEGRLIYVSEELDLSSWTHPTSNTWEAIRPTVQDVPGAPNYEALSYTWGSALSRRAVLVEDPNLNIRTKLLVTKSLATALIHLRYKDEARTLWVDAICIDQQDTMERNIQVQRMPQVYSLARRVVVWLGPGSRQSKLAMSTLSFLGEQVQVTRQNHLVGTPRAAERDWYDDSCDLPYNDETWRSILRLFQRRWFTRVWVVQEVTLANTGTVVQCGEETILWAAFRRAVLCMSTKYNLPSQDLRSEVASIAGLATYSREAPYSNQIMYDRDCSDQRDRVYGLLGLMSEGLRQRIQADYSLPVEEVYKHAALAQIEHWGRLDPLHGCIDSGDPRIIDAPSWVPDLILPPPSTETARQQFSAGMSRCITRHIDPNILEVSGLRAGTVSTVHHEFSDRLGDGLELMRDWNLGDLVRAYPGGGSLMDAVAMIVCGLKIRERLPWLPRLPNVEEWKTYCQRIVLEGEDPPGEMGQVSGLYISAVEAVLFRRKLFFTVEGYVGLGPQGMESGDIATILLGYSAPMILRESSNGTYQVVGEAVVYGFHDATCILGPLPKPWAVQIFQDSTGLATLYRFFNSETGELAEEDPRLGPLRGWERLDTDRTADDPEIFQRFRNLSTREVTNFDPRMLPDSIKSRGVPTTTFCLS